MKKTLCALAMLAGCCGMAYAGASDYAIAAPANSAVQAAASAPDAELQAVDWNARARWRCWWRHGERWCGWW